MIVLINSVLCILLCSVAGIGLYLVIKSHIMVAIRWCVRNSKMFNVLINLNLIRRIVALPGCILTSNIQCISVYLYQVI